MSDKAKKKSNIGQKISGIIILAAAGVCGGLAGLLLAHAEEKGLDF